MAFIDKFLGKRVEIPDDRRYSVKQGLWAKMSEKDVIFGLTEPSLVLIAGINDLEWIASEGKGVQKGDTVVFSKNRKITYIDSPNGGIIHFNPEAKQDPSLVTKDTYGKGWLFKIRPDEPVDDAFHEFVSATNYAQSLKGSEGYKNPNGLKGGVSGICKAVYTGIREQKL